MCKIDRGCAIVNLDIYENSQMWYLDQIAILRKVGLAVSILVHWPHPVNIKLYAHVQAYSIYYKKSTYFSVSNMSRAQRFIKYKCASVSLLLILMCGNLQYIECHININNGLLSSYYCVILICISSSDRTPIHLHVHVCAVDICFDGLKFIKCS